MLFPEFRADLSRYKEMQVYCTHYKNAHLSPQFCTPLAHGAIILTQDFYIGLHKPVKFYPDPLRFAGVIREKPIFSKCILRCHAFA